MKLVGRERLARAIPQCYFETQLEDLRYIARRNARNLQQLGRLGADLIIKATELNSGIVPLPEQLRLQLIRKAKRDAKRSRN